MNLDPNFRSKASDEKTLESAVGSAIEKIEDDWRDYTSSSSIFIARARGAFKGLMGMGGYWSVLEHLKDYVRQSDKRVRKVDAAIRANRQSKADLDTQLQELSRLSSPEEASAKLAPAYKQLIENAIKTRQDLNRRSHLAGEESRFHWYVASTTTYSSIALAAYGVHRILTSAGPEVDHIKTALLVWAGFAISDFAYNLFYGRTGPIPPKPSQH